MTTQVYKTVIKVEVLHEYPEWTDTNLSVIEYEIMEGGSSGLITIESTEPLSIEQLVEECKRHHTDLEFFIGYYGEE